MKRRRRQFGGVDRLGSGRYRVRVTDPATGERVRIGVYQTKGEAEHALARTIAEQGRGQWVRPDAATITLADYSAEWLASRLGRSGEPLRPRVRELYQGQLRRHILPSLGHLQLGYIAPATVRAWYARLAADGPGTSTTAKCYRLLRAILNTAVDDGRIATNPCTIRGAGAEHAPERRLPSVEQVFALADTVGPRYRALVLVAAFSGLRRGELLGLRREHVDIGLGTVTVAAQRQELASGEQIIGPPKSDAGCRTVALPPEALEALAEHLDRYTPPEPGAWVFTGDKGGPLREGVWHQEWARARQQVGLPDLHFHDLRHLAATLAAATGAGVKEIMYRIGHSSPQAALRYQHASTRRDQQIADGISRLISLERDPPQPPDPIP